MGQLLLSLFLYISTGAFSSIFSVEKNVGINSIMHAVVAISTQISDVLEADDEASFTPIPQIHASYNKPYLFLFQDWVTDENNSEDQEPYERTATVIPQAIDHHIFFSADVIVSVQNNALAEYAPITYLHLDKYLLHRSLLI
jgi:hypothetical protein